MAHRRAAMYTWPMSRLHTRVLSMLVEHGVEPGHRLGVGCSGGADSAALAHVSASLGRAGALGPVVLAHIDHGLRPDSAADARAVAALARTLGAGVAIRAVVVDRRGASLERAAREARYQAFEDLAREHQLRWILLAHTASDQAETVLMRVLRGTGVAGLAAIPPQRDRYLRPLLGTTRQEIEAYVTEHGVAWVRDPMNEDPAFLRSRIRHRWLPALRAENPALDQALVRLARSAAAQREVLDFAATTLLAQARASQPGTAPDAAAAPVAARPATSGSAPQRLDIASLGSAPEAVVRRALALAVEQAGGGPLGAKHLRALHDLVQRPTSGTLGLDLPGVRAVREYQTLLLDATRAGSAPGPAAEAAAGVVVRGSRPPYVVRRWRPGDRMRPARLKGRSRKLSDLFTDAKVPLSARQRAIIVARQSDGVIEWAEHIGPAHDAEISVALTSPDPVASNKL
jgi:tRNA(Ile)-lysidine synthase